MEPTNRPTLHAVDQIEDNIRPISIRDLARNIGCTEDELSRALDRLSKYARGHRPSLFYIWKRKIQYNFNRFINYFFPSS